MGLTLLAIDSAGAACSAAVWRDGRIAGAGRRATERGHAEHLAPLVALALAEAGIAAAALDAVAVSVGPGSFTGLRVGLALARGIALGRAIPAWGFSSFDLHAAAVPAAARAGRPLAVALDSRRAELFVQLFDSGLVALGAPLMAEAASAAESLPADAALAGDAAARVAAHRPGIAVLADGPADAAALAVLAVRRHASGEAPLPPRPVYLRAPDVTAP